jgi:hypothetical protein
MIIGFDVSNNAAHKIYNLIIKEKIQRRRRSSRRIPDRSLFTAAHMQGFEAMAETHRRHISRYKPLYPCTSISIGQSIRYYYFVQDISI